MRTGFTDSHTIHADVAITGGGMVGATLAAALAMEGVRVVLIDHAAPASQQSTQYDGRASAIALATQRIFEHTGAWESMRAGAEPILDIRVTDRDGPFFLHYDHHEVGTAPFGYIIENRVIRCALHERLRTLESLTWLAPATVAEIRREPGMATLMLEDGRICHAPLLVGAEGRQSPLRAHAGIGVREFRYGQTAIVCTIAHELPHAGIAVERFLPSGPFAVLPMTGQRSCIVWTEADDLAPRYVALDPAELLAELRARVGDWLGKITLAGPCFTYPLRLQLADDYTSRRLALVGDAAHAIHPIAGQGVNLGLRDVAVLSELVVGAFRLGLDVGNDALLAHYQRWRRFDAVSMALVTDGLNRLFSNRSGALRLARGVGLEMVGKIPPLKRFLMRHAMGLVGDLPRMMRARDAA